MSGPGIARSEVPRRLSRDPWAWRPPLQVWKPGPGPNCRSLQDWWNYGVECEIKERVRAWQLIPTGSTFVPPLPFEFASSGSVAAGSGEE